MTRLGVTDDRSGVRTEPPTPRSWRIVTRMLGGLFLALTLAVSASAQALPVDRLTPALPTAGERKAADLASWATALTVVALDVRTSWTSPDRMHALELQGVRAGVTYGSVFAAKLLIHRSRPCAPACGSDNPDYSFFSGHTAIAFSAIGGPRLSIVIPLAVTTGGLRVGSGKHYLSDVIVAAGVGSLASLIR